MKRMIVAVLSMMFVCNSAHAMNILQKPFVSVGQSLDNTNLPLLGKLTNFLPFAMVAAGLQQCPGQSMMLLTGLLVYVLSQNEKVRELYEKYKALGLAHLGLKKPVFDDNDETLFIFDGEDAEDAEEEMETEDELLNSDSDDDDDFRKKEPVVTPHHQLKFL